MSHILSTVHMCLACFIAPQRRSRYCYTQSRYCYTADSAISTTSRQKIISVKTSAVSFNLDWERKCCTYGNTHDNSSVRAWRAPGSSSLTALNASGDTFFPARFNSAPRSHGSKTLVQAVCNSNRGCVA